MKPQSVTRSYLFWIFQGLLFLVFSILAFHYYPKAFPIVDLEFRMDRSSALKLASQVAQRHHWGPHSFKQAASFELDDKTQTFVELSAGGSEAFSRIIKNGIYSPYTWRVRHFAEGNANETSIFFTPSGDFYGFSQHIPENTPGKALSSDEALKIAETSAVENWKTPLNEFKLIEKSQSTLPSKRIEHTFVYERVNEKIGDGQYRLKLAVNGDQLTELRYFVKIPEAFSRRYGEMRSFNSLISTIASVAMLVLYILLGCGLGIFFLARQKWILWKQPVICAAIISGFQLLEHLNQLPLSWMSYDTAISSQGFLIKNLASALAMGFSDFILLVFSFIAAESLTRKAFPQHPQLWKVWSSNNAASISILGRTLGGYLTVGFFFSYLVLIYYFGSHYLGWWNPSDTLFNPDGLATYCPWFTSIANSLHAGFWEECLFRAVPLAGAVLLGRKWGKPKVWLTAGFLIQALVFAAAHANYPAQPSYARVVELIIPSFLFGTIYLLFGLLPGIILHFTFDVVSFSIPLFTTSAPRVWIDRSLVILITLIPLWFVLYSRWRQGKWKELPPSEFNQAWSPQKTATPNKQGETLSIRSPLISSLSIKILAAASSITLILAYFLMDRQMHFPPLSINRSQAIEIAHSALEKNGIHLSSSWEALASISEDYAPEKSFIWKSEGKNKFQELMGTYLMPSAWLVRFVRFDTEVDKRAEEYQVFVVGKGDIYRIRHELPESQKGENLEKEKAKEIAAHAIFKIYGMEATQLKEANSQASQLPHRKDWLFIFTDPLVKLNQGEARVGVHVAGNEVIASRKFIFIPEEWERKEMNKQNILGIIKLASMLILIVIMGSGFILSLINWTQKKFSVPIFQKTFLVLSTVGLIDLLNSLPGQIAHFSTISPKSNQFISIFAFGFVMIAVLSVFLATTLGFLIHFYASHFKKRSLSKINILITGSLLGVLTLATGSILTSFFKDMPPRLGSLSALNYAFPFFTGIKSIEQWAFLSVILFIITYLTDWVTHTWSHRKPVGIFVLALFSLGLFGRDITGIQSWLISSSVGFGLFFMAYYFYFRRNVLLIPITASTLLIGAEIQQILLNPHVGAIPISIEAITLLILSSIILVFRFQTK